MPKNIMLFSLQTFSTTGGIQKMTRTLAYSLNQLADTKKWNFSLWSLHDHDSDIMPQYLPADKFKGFKNRRLHFMQKSFRKAHSPNIIIISHINLALVGLIIQAINPKCKVWLIAHGIEVWRPLSFIKKRFLKRCDKVLCVSHYTREEIIRWHKVNPEICYIFNNAVDPFMKLPAKFDKPQHLLNKYGLTAETPVIFTLTRLASTEQYKGHDQVIKALATLQVFHPNVKYILAGKYDEAEEIRINGLIKKYKAKGRVILTGFIEESNLIDYFVLADLFVLPSKKEGFGIVFIEALACGLPVICGNVDGSNDAIRYGELGEAINPDDLAWLEKAITERLSIPLTTEGRKQLQNQCLHYFNEQDYRGNLKALLTNE